LDELIAKKNANVEDFQLKKNDVLQFSLRIEFNLEIERLTCNLEEAVSLYQTLNFYHQTSP
jgi:hypothetical protein